MKTKLKPNETHVGRMLYAAIETKGWTFSTLARKIGKTRQWCSAVARGEIVLSIDMALTLQTALRDSVLYVDILAAAKRDALDNIDGALTDSEHALAEKKKKKASGAPCR